MSFLSDLLKFESGARNVPNVHQGTSSGQAQGFFQITTGTWRDFARKAGVDLAQYPTALSAPYAVQARVAGLLPLKRWDPITLRKLTAAGHRFDPEATLAQNLSTLGESFDSFKPTGLPASAAVVTGAGQSTGDYVSPDTPVPGATQPNFTLSGEGQDPQNNLASIFGNALGSMSIGGGGGSSGISNNIPPGDTYSLPVSPVEASPDELAQQWDASEAARALSPLAGLFSLPTIGQPDSKLKAARDAQAYGMP